MKKIYFPVEEKKLGSLKVGDFVFLDGIIYTARDAAHKKIFKLIKENKNLPFPLKSNLIYYVGPTPTPPGKIVGSFGPTTSSRMDGFTPLLYQMGLKGTMGKGGRNKEVRQACRQYKSIYLITFGGCGAYLSQFVKKIELISFEELGAEGTYKVEVENFPAIVGIDIYGNYLYNF